MNTLSFVLSGMFIALSLICLLLHFRYAPSRSVVGKYLSAGLGATAAAIFMSPDIGLAIALLSISFPLHFLTIFASPVRRGSLAVLQVVTLLSLFGFITLVPPAVLAIAWTIVVVIGLFGFIDATIGGIR